MRQRDRFAPDASILVRLIAARPSLVGGIHAIVEGIDALCCTCSIHPERVLAWSYRRTSPGPGTAVLAVISPVAPVIATVIPPFAAVIAAVIPPFVTPAD